MERILCLDYGDRRIGIAVSDLLNITAQPIGYITVRGDNDALTQIESFINQFEIKKMVLGLPKNMDGTEGERALKTRRFADKLTQRFGVSVNYFDERMTSISADRALNDLNVSGRNKKGKTDTLSAVIILQNYMRSKL